ncbi:MAG: TRAP transporter large permease subunit [Christensenellaceae bacterium]|nr:TRAP transporter large permease subunit [Christensenellaceae bacterium]
MQLGFWVLIAMLGTFLVANMLFKLPVSISMVLGAIVGAVVGGKGFPLRHLFEGSFVYLDTMLIILTATLFMRVIEKSGAMDALGATIVHRFHKAPATLLILVMLIIMFPGMITGSSAAAVLSVGAIVAQIFQLIGIPDNKSGAILAIGAILGMAAPPVSIPAMLIAGGVDMPYIGFAVPLLCMTIPCAIFTVLFLGYRHCKGMDYEKIHDKLDLETAQKYGIRLYAPIGIVLVLMALTRAFPSVIPNLGMPLIFVIGTVCGVFVGKRFDFLETARQSIADTVPVCAKLVGVGMFIQILTLTGARGTIVVGCLGLGVVLLYVCCVTVLPVFGAISSFGASSVFGVPFLLAMLSGNQIVTASALALLASMGDLMPPTALAGNYAAQIVKQKYSDVFRACLVPAAVCLAVGLLFLIFSKNLGFLV